MDVEPGTIVLFGDLICPWATIAVERFHRARARTGVDVTLVHRAYPLELFDEEPHPKPVYDGELDLVTGLAPDLFRPWAADDWAWPVTTLLAMEAVWAAGDAGEALDRALRRAVFHDSRCISLRSVILEVAAGVDGLDTGALGAALDDGRCRRAVMDDFAVAGTDEVNGSPHAFLPDGSDAFNPGIELRSEGGGPVLVSDDPAAWDDLVRRAAR